MRYIQSQNYFLFQSFLSIHLPILVGLSMQMLAPTGLPFPARLLIGLLVPWLEPRTLYNFTSSLASSISPNLQVVLTDVSDVILTLVEGEAEHSNGGLSRKTNFVSRQTAFFTFSKVD